MENEKVEVETMVEKMAEMAVEEKVEEKPQGSSKVGKAAKRR